MSDKKVIEINNLRKEYFLGQTKIEALRGITATVDKGEFIAVAGPSGSGKSTLLNMIGCIDIPTSGTVSINGQMIGSLSEKEITRYRRVHIGFIFQSFNLIPVLSVYENIELPLLLQKIPSSKERQDRIMHFIEEVGLSDRIRNKPHELSGGQRQRVAIARALVTKPVIILADEPTANLDSTTGGRILDLMSDINTKEGTTFLFSTHDKHIMDHARRIITIQDGMIIDDLRKA